MSDSIAMTWGSTPQERAQPLPCDSALENPTKVWHRAIDVAAPASVTFRWLCQLRKAPYSYDLLDNFGRRSPRTLTPGLEDLEAGQTMMMFYDVVSFEPGRHITAVFRSFNALFGRRVVSYVVQEDGPDRSRILVRVRMRRPGGPLGLVVPHTLPWIDLVMMRKQLRTLAKLAERQAAADRQAAAA
ncbi:MAG: hypothetical protein JWO02_131 [Solirubrobacterales bacterium]|nr:hypothetical protein [Solirubrobacterales bacterium]